VLSEVLAEATLGFSVPRSSATICTDCDAAAISLSATAITTFQIALHRRKSGLSVDRSQRSARCERRQIGGELGIAGQTVSTGSCQALIQLLQSPECRLAPFRSPEERLLCKVCNACCN